MQTYVKVHLTGHPHLNENRGKVNSALLGQTKSIIARGSFSLVSLNILCNYLILKYFCF